MHKDNKMDVCELCVYYKKKNVVVGICDLFHSFKKKSDSCEQFTNIYDNNTKEKKFKKIIIKNGEKIYI